MKRILSTTVVCALLTSSASAEITYDMFDRERQNGFYQMFFDGLTTGISWANVAADSEGDPFYCAPEKMAITRDQYLDILDRYVTKRGRDARQNFVGMVLIKALRDTFPCK